MKTRGEEIRQKSQRKEMLISCHYHNLSKISIS